MNGVVESDNIFYSCNLFLLGKEADIVPAYIANE